MNQLVLAGLAAAVLAAGAFTAGWRVNEWRRDSQELSNRDVEERATAAAVEAIKGLKIERITIRQELEREIHHQPAVGAECDISDGVLHKLNEGLAPPGSRGAGVPGPDAAP
jgi:hypothetical protein